jgi:hypothetical protein
MERTVRNAVVIVHTALAAFFLPMGLMYALTGGLYGLGIKGEYRTAEHSVALAEPLVPELSVLSGLAERELRSRGLELPSGGAQIRKGGTSFYMEWTGSRLDVELHPTDDPTRARLRIKQTTPHRFFVQLRKAKGGERFTQFAAAWMVGLVVLFISGGLLALMCEPYRWVALAAGAVGVGVFVALAWTS